MAEFDKNAAFKNVIPLTTSLNFSTRSEKLREACAFFPFVLLVSETYIISTGILDVDEVSQQITIQGWLLLNWKNTRTSFGTCWVRGKSNVFLASMPEPAPGVFLAPLFPGGSSSRRYFCYEKAGGRQMEKQKISKCRYFPYHRLTCCNKFDHSVYSKTR